MVKISGAELGYVGDLSNYLELLRKYKEHSEVHEKCLEPWRCSVLSAAIRYRRVGLSRGPYLLTHVYHYVPIG